MPSGVLVGACLAPSGEKILLNSSERRLARALLLLAHFGKKQSRGVDAESKSGNARGDDWYNALTIGFLHEQIPETRLY